MDRCVRLSNKFYSMDLYYGKTNLKPCHDFQCFFIVEHPCSDEFIHNQALMLLTSQCENFDFYGAYSRKWDIGFDLVDMQLHPNEADMDVALTSARDNLDDFVDALELALSTRTFIPCDIYLIYDDKEIYETVLARLKKYITYRGEDFHAVHSQKS